VPRGEFQSQLQSLNADASLWSGIEAAPDGDAELPAAAVERFCVPGCTACGGVMKPDVVFFGENVPRERVDCAWRLFADGDVLLVAGSSLTVYSGRRFIYRAKEQGIPVAIVNLGPTRADDVAAAKVEGRLGEVLPRLAETLAPQA
jgi:NAD-dependent SIR2 family protein deacetylase